MTNINPIEKLQIYSMINKDYFNVKNKLYCLLYQLTQRKNLIFNDKKFKLVPFNEDELNIQYEEDFLKLLIQKRYYELQSFLNVINFIPTLKRLNIIREHVKKSKFNLFNKNEYEKTEEFYKIYNEIVKITESENFITAICNKTKDDENIRKLVDKIISKRQ